MITDEDEEQEYLSSYTVDYKLSHQNEDQCMFVENDCSKEEGDLYQQLAEKDHYLILAAEAGKVLLEKNQELTNHYQSLQDEYQQKIEELEQEKHHLKRQLVTRGNCYDSRMQDLQQELHNLSGQLDMVQKSSRSFEQTHRSTYEDLALTNNSLLTELDEVKSYNENLAQQVQTLSKRIDGRINNGNKSYNNNIANYDATDGTPQSDGAQEKDYLEMKNLKEQVHKLSDQKRHLEESFTELAHEKRAITHEQQQTIGKVSTLEGELQELKQQISMCQEDLNKTKKKNVQLKDQLEEYVYMETSQMRTQSDNSLFNELEMSLSEADMNFQQISTPLKINENGLPNIMISPDADQAKINLENLKDDLLEVYKKLKVLWMKLTNDESYFDFNNSINSETINGEIISKIVDQIIDLIQGKVMSLGLIDTGNVSPTHLDLDNCDNLSQPDSQTSDQDVDILEQQVHDLNQRLNIATTDLEGAKKELVTSQTSARENEDKALNLTVKVNSQDREIESLRKEREIMMADTTMEEKLRMALEERDAALKRENEVKVKYEETKNDMQKLNNQLISAVEQKLELSEQLEQWQFDMASLIDQQLATKIKRDQQKSKKRSNSTNPARMFAAKFFASRNTSRDSSHSNTPTSKSPVPQKK